MHHFAGLVVLICRVAGHDLPVVKYHLREGLTVSCTAQIFVESEGFVDREIRLECLHGSSFSLFLVDDNTALLCQNGIHCTDSIFMNLDVDQVEWFDNSWFCIKN
jgi:hypothetical protein